VSEEREITEIMERLADVLDSLGIAYTIGGSLASSLYGPVRFTQDADVTIQPFAHVADQFYNVVKEEFYISEQAMHQALSSSGCFNIIHLRTGFKVDLFVQGPSELEQRLLARSKKLRLSDASRKELFVVSPEDIVLLKLRWFRESDCTSQRQWNDILGVLAMQGKSLDFEYLMDSARKLGLEELLNRAKAEAST